MKIKKVILKNNILNEQHDFSNVFLYHLEDKILSKMVTDRTKDFYIEPSF